ncbi:MAG: cytochrome c oxidase subunit IV [candidate division Zixibacteria bacterium]|nr:cytochrome c oxidase subunit IV [candidate division Zixibacteria bacterium]
MVELVPEHKHHALPLRVYLGVAGALMVLTVITVAVSYVDFGGWNVVVALLIAGFKASLVALYFMHLLYDNKLYMFIFLSAVAFLVILIVFTMFDTVQRGRLDEIKDKPIKQQAEIYEKLKTDSLDVEHEGDSGH